MSKRFTGMDFKPRNPNGRSPVSRTGQRPEIGLPGLLLKASAATSKGAGCEKGNCWQQTNSCGDEVAKTGSNKNSKHDWTCFFGLWDGYLYFMMTNGLEFQTWSLNNDDPIFHFETSMLNARFRGMC